MFFVNSKATFFFEFLQRKLFKYRRMPFSYYLINSMSAHLRTGEDVIEDEAGIGEGSTAAAIIAAAVDC